MSIFIAIPPTCKSLALEPICQYRVMGARIQNHENFFFRGFRALNLWMNYIKILYRYVHYMFVY